MLLEERSDALHSFNAGFGAETVRGGRAPDVGDYRRRSRRSVAVSGRRLQSDSGRRQTTLRDMLVGKRLVQPQGNRRRNYLVAKRLLDVLGSVTLLLLLFPVMLVTFLILLVSTRGRPLFVQRRIGFLGRPFWMLKFRTMRLDAEQRRNSVPNELSGPVFKNRNDPRITRLGRLLRKTSIDETPQLLNVLMGQMSLVGPRPPLPDEVACYELWQRRRLAVMPGLTCVWQTSGRNEVQFEQWVRMDIWYVDHQKLATDLRLLVKTPASVLSCRGAY